MKYLLDTHYLIWSIGESNKIPRKIKEILTNPENEIAVSTISFWEISLKIALGKLIIEGLLPNDLPAICSKLNFRIEPLSAEESSTFHLLKADYHKDPFDRMLIWQSLTKGYTLLTGDEQMKKYVSDGLKIFH